MTTAETAGRADIRHLTEASVEQHRRGALSCVERPSPPTSNTPNPTNETKAPNVVALPTR